MTVESSQIERYIDDQAPSELKDMVRRLGLGFLVTHLVYYPGKYIDKACLDLFPTRLKLGHAADVVRSVQIALVSTEWTIERVEWTYKSEILVDSVWLLRNARSE